MVIYKEENDYLITKKKRKGRKISSWNEVGCNFKFMMWVICYDEYIKEQMLICLKEEKLLIWYVL